MLKKSFSLIDSSDGSNSDTVAGHYMRSTFEVLFEANAAIYKINSCIWCLFTVHVRPITKESEIVE